jgi:membrane associated rhomboid family serine protease
MAVLRRHADRKALGSIWQAAIRQQPGQRKCPHCGSTMRSSKLGDADDTRLDVCTHCQMIWFDAGELVRLPRGEPPGPDGKPQAEKLSPRAAETAAMMQLESMKFKEQELAGAQGPPELWQYLPAMVGLPVECDAPPTSSLPWLTLLFIACAALATSLAYAGGLSEVVRQWGFLPSDPWRHGGLTLVSSFFIHGGLIHLLSNLYFLWMVGDNVEDHLGRLGYAGLLLLSALAGAGLHAALDPRADVPLVGASGGICGAIAYYAVVFPHSKIGCLIGQMPVVGWARLPACLWLVVFVLVQLWGAAAEVEGFGDVSNLGHLGGLAIGLSIALLVKWRGRPAAVRPQGCTTLPAQDDRGKRAQRP